MKQTIRIRIAFFSLFLYILLVIVNCSGSRMQEDSAGKVYNLGKASEFDMSNTIPRLLRKFQFDVLQSYDTGAYQSVETEWKMRYPMDDEAAVGILEGRMRLFFRIRKTMDQLFYVRLEVQNMVRTPDARDWFHAPMSEQLEREILRMVDELKQEFDESRLTR